MSPLFPGVDLIEISRFQSVLDRHGPRFLNRVYTAREQNYCGDRVSELAARFAAKEAVMKALGTGVRGVGWREIEILATARGKPVVLLHGKARLRAQKIGLHELEVSLTHEREMACALVMGSGPSPEPPTDGSAAS